MKNKLTHKFIKTWNRSISREFTIEYAFGLNSKVLNNQMYSNNCRYPSEFVTELKMFGKSGGLIVCLFDYLNINLAEVAY